MTKTVKAKLAIGILGLLGIILILISTSKCGAGLSPDSANYISTARNLLDGKGFYTYKSPYVKWPPLFPPLLAVAGFGKIDPIVTARYINAVCFGLILILAGLWLLENIKSFYLIIMGSLIFLVSKPLFRVSIYVLTEPIFILLALLFLFEIKKYLETDSHRSLYLAAIYAALSILTRYIGVTLTATGILLLLLKQNKSLKQKLTNIFVFSTVSILPTIVWIVRNYLVTSTLTGNRELAPNTFLGITTASLDAMSMWFFSLKAPPVPRFILFLVLLISILGFLIYNRHNKDNQTKFDSEAIIPLGYFVVVYTSILIIITTFIAIDHIENRFLVPVYVPLVLIIIYLTDNVKHISKKSSIVLLLLLNLWLGHLFWRTAKAAKNHLEYGAGGYALTRWENSIIIDYIKKHPLEGEVFSNHPGALYIHAGISAKKEPGKHLPPASEQTKAYYVLFRKESRGKLLSHPDFDLKPKVTKPDGIIYLIKRKG